MPLASVRLEGDAAGGLARIRIEQTFRNPHAEPLAATYQLPLPERGGLFSATGLGFGGPGRVTNGFIFLNLKPELIVVIVNVMG